MMSNDKDAKAVSELVDLRIELNEMIQDHLEKRGLIDRYIGNDERLEALQEARDLVIERLDIIKDT